MVTKMQWSALLERFVEHGDEQRVIKARQLLANIDIDGGRRVHVALCGHFSAGKSSLINTLVGRRLLPSSPIPTSANIVSIEHGAERAEIQYHDGRIPETIAINQLDEVCKDGEVVSAVRIFYPLDWLGANVVLLDTPGIDSTDGAHALATHSALHIADIVLYVTDYNHVQSEVNFDFSKKLADWGKPLYFVINQIDKHKQQEIAFSEYDRRIRESFSLWGIEPAGFLYISAKYAEYPLNQFTELQHLLTQFANHSSDLRRWSMNSSFKQLIDEHVDFVRQEQTLERQRLQDELAECDIAELRNRYKANEDILSQMQANRERRIHRFEIELDQLLHNAPLMPAPVRDLASLFLESQKSSFRSGFLWFGKNTNEERSERVSQLVNAFGKQMDTQIMFHVHSMLNRLLDELKWSPEAWHGPIQALLNHGMDDQFLLSRIKTGALDSAEYLLNYCADASDEAKRLIRRSVHAFLTQMNDEWLRIDELQATTLRSELASWQRTIDVDRQLVFLDEQLLQLSSGLLAFLEKSEEFQLTLPIVPTPDESLLLGYVNDGTSGKPIRIEEGALLDSSPLDVAEQPPHMDETDGLLLTIQRLEAAISHVRKVPSATNVLRSLELKRVQLQNRTFTAALFGAFSAGKSSFANALMGVPLLPVSPNPTTAAINRIVPVATGVEGGTVVVRMKSLERLADDVQHSLKMLGIASKSFDEALHLIPAISTQDVSVKGRPHLSFLQAVQVGWQDCQPILGTQVKTDLQDFGKYVADERWSCFVEDVEIQHDNVMTQKRISLVDTPGADSVNARHTHISFEYIKNADVILFVTYYNHAFSQADRDFLIQLGRVKDRFQLDKMLFVINAADLASSGEELRDVCDHVRTQLAQFGIHEPKLFPLSSQNGLLAKRGETNLTLEETGLGAFEQAFYRFIQQELSVLLSHGAEQEISASKQVIQHLLQLAQSDEKAKHTQLVKLRSDLQELTADIGSRKGAHLFAALRREMEELVFYVKQRQRFQFGERYQRSFNPALLREDLRDMGQAMRAAWFDLLTQFQGETVRELQATGLRMEQHMYKELEQYINRLQADIRSRWQSYLANIEISSFESVPFAENFNCELDTEWLIKQYKNSRSFFAEGGSSKLRTLLENKVLASLDQFTDECSERMFAHYLLAFEQQWQHLIENVIDSMRQYVDYAEQSHGDEVDTGLLLECHEKLKRM